MAFGFQFFNGNGDLLLDNTTLENFQFIEKFSVTPTNLGGSGVLDYRTYPDRNGARIFGVQLPVFGNDVILRYVPWYGSTVDTIYLGQNTSYSRIFHHCPVELDWGLEGDGTPYLEVKDGGVSIQSSGGIGNTVHNVENHYEIQYPPQTIWVFQRKR